MYKIKEYIQNPKRIISYLAAHQYFNFLDDEEFIHFTYKIVKGKKLNLKNPITFNEKLQWLKLYDRNPKYTQLVDKYEVRNYIKDTIGEKYLIPLFGVWNAFEDINFDDLPNQFVLKTTHDSGGVVICKDKSSFNLNKAKRKLNKSLKRNYFYSGREWPYKNVKPRIIAEQYLHHENDDDLKDYRLFCFNGKPKFIAVDFNITDKSKTKRNLYDLDWNLLPARISYPNELELRVDKPEKLNELIALSEQLSENIPHVRVDFYNVNNNIYFGEMTFFHQGGLGNIIPSKFDIEMGSWINLPRKLDN